MLLRLLHSMLRDRRRTAALAAATVHARHGEYLAAEKLLAALPGGGDSDPDVLNLRGLAAMQQGRHDEAIAHLQLAARLAPDSAAYLANLGEALRSAGRHAGAETVLGRAIAIDPGFAAAHLNLAVVLNQRGRIDESIDAARRAVQVEPGGARNQLALGCFLLTRIRAEEALPHLRRAAELDADLLAARYFAYKARAQLCDWPAPRGEMLSLLELWRDGDPRTSEFQPFAAYEVSASAELRRAVAQRYADRVLAAAGPQRGPFERIAQDGERLRLGYLSADFQDHATMHLAAGMFARHDRSHFEVFAYSFGADDGGDYRQRLIASVEHFVDIRDEPFAASAERIGRDRIQVLVDLKGFTRLARPEILALRPAPVQVNWLGYPGTMGHGLADYIIADRTVAPPGSAAEFGEQLALMPHSYQVNDCEQPIASARPSRGDCGLPDSGFVFACFNSAYKIEEEVFDVWMRILGKVPRAMLWLWRGTEEVTSRNLRAAARRRGVDPDRLIFAANAPKPQHLARIAHADLVLDTPRINAHTGASDALWAGVPILTCIGDGFPGRVAASLLRSIGLPELVAATLDEYEALAVRIAGEPAWLAGLRARLHANRHSAPLFDTGRFVRDLERCYGLMWQIHAGGSAPAPFSVLA